MMDNSFDLKSDDETNANAVEKYHKDATIRKNHIKL